MTFKRIAQILGCAAVGMLFVSGVPACDGNCRDIGDGDLLKSGCTPPCDTGGDCESGEICVEDRLRPSEKICAVPCESSTSDCNCECADGETGFCGDPERVDLECRADGDLARWQETYCACQTDNDDLEGFHACLDTEASFAANLPEACKPVLANERFCRHHNTTLSTAGECQVPEYDCSEEAQALVDCQTSNPAP